MAESTEHGVHRTGAPAGSTLIGIGGDLTEGLRLNVYSEQGPGDSDDHGGTPITGRFRLLDAGTGTYAKILKPLEGQDWSSDTLLAKVQEYPDGAKCKFLLNRSRLKRER